jgi:hypothetical protein
MAYYLENYQKNEEKSSNFPACNGLDILIEVDIFSNP